MPRSRRHSWESPPTSSVRPVLRVFALLAILGMGFWLAYRLNRTPLPASPLPSAAESGKPRQAPFADTALLAGAVQNEPFLVENPDLLLPSPRNERQRKDADARYHLLLLAATTRPEWLLRDARPGPSLAQLRAEATERAGELLRFDGELVALQPLPLKRDAVAGLTQAYQAAVLVEPLEPVLFLFTQWPEDWPTPSQLLAEGGLRVRVAGYFLKNAKLEMPGEPSSARIVPVLVGHSPWPLPSPPNPLAQLPLVFAVMAVPVGILLLLAWRWHRREDQQLRARLVAARTRLADRDAAGLAALEADAPDPKEPTELTTPNDADEFGPRSTHGN